VPSKPMKGLIKIPLEPGSKPLPGKVSEMTLEFAQPLIEFGEGGPPDIQTMRNIMMLGMVCWNLPIMESRTDAYGPSTRRMFDDAMARMPNSLGRVLLELVEHQLGKRSGCRRGEDAGCTSNAALSWPMPDDNYFPLAPPVRR
jgi:hypothetical protein